MTGLYREIGGGCPQPGFVDSPGDDGYDGGRKFMFGEFCWSPP